MLLYSLFNLTECETSHENTNKIKHIDSLKGGVDIANDILKLNQDINKYWLPTNVTNPNGKCVWRTQNSEGIKWVKIMYGNTGL